MKKFITYVFIILCSIAHSSEKHVLFKNPIQYYVRTHFVIPDLKQDIKLGILKFDFNLDGKSDYFFTTSKSQDGAEGFMWQVYLSKGKNFYEIPDLLMFRQDYLYVGKIDELKTLGVVSYKPGKSGGHLFSYIYKDNKLLNIDMGMIEQSSAQDQLKMKKYFDLTLNQVEWHSINKYQKYMSISR